MQERGVVRLSQRMQKKSRACKRNQDFSVLPWANNRKGERNQEESSLEDPDKECSSSIKMELDKAGNEFIYVTDKVYNLSLWVFPRHPQGIPCVLVKPCLVQQLLWA